MLLMLWALFFTLMIKRIIEISSPACLSSRWDQLRVERESLSAEEVPIEDIGILVLDHPQITATIPLFQKCLQNNTAIIVSGQNHVPAGLFCPLDGNTLHAKILRDQIAVTVPAKKRIWKDIVKAKIEAQIRLLEKLKLEVYPLPIYLASLRSGDPENMEAQSSRAYWPRLFGKDFQRDRKKEGVNALLNYGYSIIHAAVARSVVGSGLHPALGIHHHNQYNAFALASDLMEPFRPLIDGRVESIVRTENKNFTIDKKIKKVLLSVLNTPVFYGNRKLPFFVALHSLTASFVRVLRGEEGKLNFPEIL